MGPDSSPPHSYPESDEVPFPHRIYLERGSVTDRPRNLTETADAFGLLARRTPARDGFRLDRREMRRIAENLTTLHTLMAAIAEDIVRLTREATEPADAYARALADAHLSATYGAHRLSHALIQFGGASNVKDATLDAAQSLRMSERRLRAAAQSTAPTAAVTSRARLAAAPSRTTQSRR